MTLLELYNKLGKIKGKHEEVVICPYGGSQHVEEITDIDFVPEIGKIVIFTKEKK